ncbi:MAG: DUF3667 domain-containing protein [Flavobacteriales bacterium]
MRTCGNCNHGLEKDSHFCGNCGQDTHHQKIPFSHFVLEFLEGLFHFDTKIWMTLKKLFLNPGIVIQEFNDNKRMRYVPPIRLYIFTSIIFFLFASSGVDKETSDLDKAVDKGEIEGRFSVVFIDATVVDSSTSRILNSIPHITEIQVDSVLKSANIESSKINNKIITNLIHLQRGEISARELGHRFITSINKLLFLLMPLFAFLILLFIGWKKHFYVETLVFSIYFHSFYFMLSILAVLINMAFSVPNVYLFVYLIASIYMVRSIRVAFSFSWLRSLLYSFALIISYTLIFAFVFVTAVLGALAL